MGESDFSCEQDSESLHGSRRLWRSKHIAYSLGLIGGNRCRRWPIRLRISLLFFCIFDKIVSCGLSVLLLDLSLELRNLKSYLEVMLDLMTLIFILA
ncbi:hypothetical protein SLE2022_080870 [Rubroshorea leprosula]